MDVEHDLRDFRDQCRLFPLSGVVMFPHAVLPLHIFEPRYRRMTEDALASDRLVTVVQARPDLPPTAAGDTAIEPVACLGKILNHERLPDGRFNFLLLGLGRVRILEELSPPKLYRVARAELIPDLPPVDADAGLFSELNEHFRKLLIRQDMIDSDLASLLDGDLSLGPLTDLIAHAMGLPPAVKQALLDQADVRVRADQLNEILVRILAPGHDLDAPARIYPPPFSTN